MLTRSHCPGLELYTSFIIYRLWHYARKDRDTMIVLIQSVNEYNISILASVILIDFQSETI